MEWPSRSADMTLSEFFLQGYLKSQVLVTPPHDMQDLRNQIQVEFEKLRQNSGVICDAVRSIVKRTQIVLKNMVGMLNKNVQKQSP